MNELQISIPAMLSSFRTLADRSMQFKVTTQELSAEMKAKLFDYEQSQGFFFFARTEMKEIEIPMGKAEFPNQKSPSERLRNVQYRFWEKLKEKRSNVPKDFEDWRRKEVEGLIEQYKRKLNEV